MLSRFRFLKVMAALVAVVCLGGQVNASTVDGSQVISDIGTTTADSSTISTATVFNLDSLLATGGNTGDFAAFGAAGLALGSATLDISNPATFTFGDATFGTFTAESILMLPGSATSVSFYLLGKFTPGTLFPADHRDIGDASFTLGFIQNGADQAISASGSLSLPPAPVAEPATIAGLLSALVISGLAVARRRLA